jgi:hypothetical protein
MTADSERAPRTGAAWAGASVLLFVAMVSFVVGRCSAPDSGDDTATTDSIEVDVEVPETWAPETAPDLVLERPDAFLDSLYEQFDGRRLNVAGMTIYPQYAYAEVQDPDNERHLDEYDFRDGYLQPESTPVAAGRFEDWEPTLFTLETVQADVIRSVARDALDEFAELENGQISYLSIERSYDSDAGVYSGPVQITVYVSDPVRGGSGTVRTSAQGEVLEVDRY